MIKDKRRQSPKFGWHTGDAKKGLASCLIENGELLNKYSCALRRCKYEVIWGQKHCERMLVSN